MQSDARTAMTSHQPIPPAILDSVPVGGVSADASHLAQHVACASVGPSPQPPQPSTGAASPDAISIQVGDLFPDMKTFRAKLGLYGITHKCPYRARRSDNSRFVGVCPTVMNELKKECRGAAPNAQSSSSGSSNSAAAAARNDGEELEVLHSNRKLCPFHVIARRRKEVGVFVTRAMLMHAPDCTAPVTFSTSATSAYMLQLMEESASSIAPREIGKFVHEATGTKLSYSTLWRTSHLLQSKERERQDASFKKIVPFLNAFREANPSTAAVVEQHANGRFYRAFLCPGTLGSSLGDCPFFLHVESMPITSCYEGNVLLAYVKDGLGAFLPLAIGITPSADEENWRFFFHQLLAALPIVGCPGISISHEKDMAIHNAQIGVLPTSRSVTDAAHFDWSSSGTLEEYYAQMAHLCTGSYYSIIVGWITQVAVLMYARFMELEAERSVFPGALLGRSTISFGGWEVASFGPSDYLVVNAREKQQVNLAIRSCSCGQWIEHSFPCIHATRCLPHERLVGLGQFIHPSYFTESIRRCYSRRMTLINADSIAPQGSSAIPGTAAYMNEHGPSGEAGVVLSAELPLLPPTAHEPVKRGRGRPRVTRTNSNRSTGVGAGYQCGHCHGKGHNSRTCPLNQKSYGTHEPKQSHTPHSAPPPDLSAPVALGAAASASAAAPPPNVFVDAAVPITLDSPLATPTTTG